MRLPACSLLSLAVSGSALAQCSPLSLITNGGFESPIVADNSAVPFVTPTGWSWVPGAGGFVFRGNVGLPWPLAPQEAQFVDIGNVGVYTLEQTFVVPHRQFVRVQWRASAAIGAPTSPYLVEIRNANTGAFFGGGNFDAAGPYAIGEFWDTETLLPALDPGAYTIRFQARGVINGFDTLIDDVRIEALQEPYQVFTSATGSGYPGQTFTLRVGVFGAAPITYRWERSVTDAAGPWTPLTDGFLPGLGHLSGTSTPDLSISQLVAGSPINYIRCVASNACGSTPFMGALFLSVPQCDSIDFNNNQVFPEDQDIIDFFNVLAGADCPTCNDIDFNNNGVYPEDQDVIDFFNVLAGGTCS